MCGAKNIGKMKTKIFQCSQYFSFMVIIFFNTSLGVKKSINFVF